MYINFLCVLHGIGIVVLSFGLAFLTVDPVGLSGFIDPSHADKYGLLMVMLGSSLQGGTYVQLLEKRK